MSEKNDPSPADTSRRSFVKKTGAIAATGAAIGFPSVTFGVPNDKKLKIGVVGTGGRGGGAMMNAMNADDNVELWAMGDGLKVKSGSVLNLLVGALLAGALI